MITFDEHEHFRKALVSSALSSEELQVEDKNRQIIMPAVYEQFRCIAGACPYTCCQEWMIGVDEETAERWKSCEGNLYGCIDSSGENPVLKLGADRKCLQLNREGLCRVVIRYGDDAIPEACRQFPRQIQRFADRTEYTLNPGCPETVRLLEECGKFWSDETLQTLAGKDSSGAGAEDSLPAFRLLLTDICLDERLSLAESMSLCGLLLSEACRRGRALSEEERREICSPGYIETFREAFRASAPPEEDCLRELNEIFLDVTENYCQQGMYKEFLVPLRKMAEKLEDDPAGLSLNAEQESWRLLKRVFAMELFGCGAPEEGIRELALLGEWTIMELALIRHSLRLLRAADGHPCSKAAVCECIVIIARIMGFCHDDVFEYMEDCFEDPVWDWDYIRLIS